MRQLRIKGLVKIASAVRRELSGPVAPGRKEELRRWVAQSLREVDRITAGQGVTVTALPEPSRRAYRFLQTVDFDGVPEQAADSEVPIPRGNISLVGINAILDEFAAKAAEPMTDRQADELHASIRQNSVDWEAYLQREGFTGADLTPKSRAPRGWLAFFAERENFDAYVAAVNRARAAFESAIARSRRFSAPAIVEFRPIRGLYRIRGFPRATRVMMDTPMMCFSAELFASVAEGAILGGPKQAMVEAAEGEAYQGIRAELDSLSGVEEHTAGVYRDLAVSFQRVVADYFGGSFPRPRLTWSRAFTGRKFGHYDSIRDTVMISCTLDRADVPEFVLDSVMHHELLHKKLGVRWHDGRMHAHPAEFRREERTFTQYAEADAILRRLAAHA